MIIQPFKLTFISKICTRHIKNCLSYTFILKYSNIFLIFRWSQLNRIFLRLIRKYELNRIFLMIVGTTFSCVGVYHAVSGAVDILEAQDGHQCIPSVVAVRSEMAL